MVKQSFGSSAKWAYVMQWSGRGVSSLTTFFLAYLLKTSDFGLLALAWVYIQFIQMFLEQGLGAAIVQRKILNKRHMDAAFWMILSFSCLLFTISIILSGWWASLNGAPALAEVIVVLSVMLPIQGLTIVQRSLFQRNLAFKKLALLTLTSVFSGSLTGISLALLGYGVWALVSQHLVYSFILMVMFWKSGGWRPRFRFSLNAARELLGFSLRTFSAKLGMFATVRAETYLMGIFFSSTSVVGIYRLADSVVVSILEVGINALTSVSLAHFSLSQESYTRLRQDFENCVRVNSIAIIPVLMLTAVMSDTLIAVLGGRWMPAADALKVLCLVGILQSFTTFTGPLLMGIGRPGLFALLLWLSAAAANLSFSGAALYLQGYSEETQVFGISMTRLFLTALIYFPLFFGIALNRVQLPLKAVGRAIFLPIVAGCAACLAIMTLRMVVYPLTIISPVIKMVAEGFIGALIIILILFKYDSMIRSTVHQIMASFIEKYNFKVSTHDPDSKPIN